jgi:hypothetical protein
MLELNSTTLQGSIVIKAVNFHVYGLFIVLKNLRKSGVFPPRTSYYEAHRIQANSIYLHAVDI